MDTGHHCIWLALIHDEATLILENPLVGRKEKLSKILATDQSIHLEEKKWYDVSVEIKGDEVPYQIVDFKFYGKDPLIAKNSIGPFNFDSIRSEFLLKDFKINEAKP